ncbi:hypothetical protein AAVH_06734 [Aphelenchoides avenae]|nr:hypothetical protein AAVH_06734 [Aphelenchus avenae]
MARYYWLSTLYWWECERTRVQFILDGFCPSFECHVPSATDAAKNAQGSRRYENRAEAIAHGAFVSQSHIDFHHLVGLKNRLKKMKQQQKPQ